MNFRKIIIILIIFCCKAYCGDSLKILFLGDTYFGESYQENPKYNYGVNVIDEYGYDYFFENVRSLLISADYTIANLETSLISRQAEYLTKPYSHWSYGSKTCEYLNKYGIDAVSLGNNHVMDYGVNGIMETISLLNKHSIKYFGAGADLKKAGSPLIVNFTTGGKQFAIAVFGGFEYRQSYDTIYNAYAGDSTPGINVIDTAEIIKEVRFLKEHNKDVFIVFFPHWGKNYKQAMNYQKEIARSLINGGVDLIIGHGSHTIQEMEKYKGRFILYNIGNFIFNAPGRYSSTGAKPYGLMTELVVTGQKKLLRMHPVFTNNKLSDFKVRFLDEDEMLDCYQSLYNQAVKIKRNNFFEIELP